MTTILEISVEDLAEAYVAGSPPLVLDVREDEEWQAGHLQLPNVLHMPMNSVPEHMFGLDKNQSIAVMCRSGGRSAQVTQYLQEQGFSDVKNVIGGMQAWRNEIDPKINVA